MARSRYFWIILMIIAVLLLMMVSERKAGAIITISLFITANMLLASYKRFIQLPIEIEVLTLGIVVTTLTFGLKAGLVVAIFGGILSFIVGFNVSPFSFPMLLGYILMALLAYIFNGYELFWVGMIATFANNLLVFALYHSIFQYDLFKNLSFGISNIVFNVIIFYNIAPWVVIILPSNI